MSNDMRSSSGSNPTSHLVLGLLIASIGVLFTLNNLHLLHLGNLFRYWPVALIVVGAMHVSQSRGAGGWIGGALWIGVGTVLLGNGLGYFHVGLWSFWPLLLVFIGARMILQSRDADATPGDLDSGSAISAIAVMGNVDRRITSQAFKRAEITAFLGGGKLDLHDATLAGGQAVVNVLAVMGGFQILVPAHWNVVLQVSPFMGGAADKRRVPATLDPDAPRLTVRGFLLMVGVEIKD